MYNHLRDLLLLALVQPLLTEQRNVRGRQVLPNAGNAPVTWWLGKAVAVFVSTGYGVLARAARASVRVRPFQSSMGRILAFLNSKCGTKSYKEEVLSGIKRHKFITSRTVPLARRIRTSIGRGSFIQRRGSSLPYHFRSAPRLLVSYI